MNNQNDECCPVFDVNKWDKKTFNWDNKLFIKESIPTFFHMPLPSMISKKMTRVWTLAETAGANLADKSEALVMFRDPTAFRSEIYYSVTKDVEGANNIALSGTFVAGVFEGPYNSVPVHVKEMNKRLAADGKKADDYYIHYAYCPKCAKEQGHNYMILFAKV